MNIRTIGNFEYWYSRTLRLWVAIELDSNGYLCSDYFYTKWKEEIIELINEKQKEKPRPSFEEILEEEEEKLRRKDVKQWEMYQDEDFNYSGNR